MICEMLLSLKVITFILYLFANPKDRASINSLNYVYRFVYKMYQEGYNGQHLLGNGWIPPFRQRWKIENGQAI